MVLSNVLKLNTVWAHPFCLIGYSGMAIHLATWNSLNTAYLDVHTCEKWITIVITDQSDPELERFCKDEGNIIKQHIILLKCLLVFEIFGRTNVLQKYDRQSGILLLTIWFSLTPIPASSRFVVDKIAYSIDQCPPRVAQLMLDWVSWIVQV